MKYSLRSLMIMAILGPPLLAFLVYGWRQFLPREHRILTDSFLAVGTAMTSIGGFYVYLEKRERLILVCSVVCLIGLTVLLIDLVMP